MLGLEERHPNAIIELEYYFDVSNVHRQLAEETIRLVVEEAARQKEVTEQMALDYAIGNLQMLLDELASSDRGLSVAVTAPLLWVWEESDKTHWSPDNWSYMMEVSDFVGRDDMHRLFDASVKAVEEVDGSVCDLIVVLTLSARALIDHFVQAHAIAYRVFFKELEWNWATVGVNKETTEGKFGTDVERETIYYPFGDRGARLNRLRNMRLR